MAAGPGELRLVEVTDERSVLARRALALIQESIWDVHPLGYLLRELEETRHGVVRGGGFHLLSLVSPADTERPLAAATGVYLQEVNAGFVSYLAVPEAHRGRGLGRRVREGLLEVLRAEARRARGVEPAWVLGEVERESAWLRTLLSEGRVRVLDVPYFHPWMSRRAEGVYALYLEPMADPRSELPSAEVARLIEAIWRRAYRVSHPHQSDTFQYMLRRLAGRPTVGAAPDDGPGPPAV